MTINPITRAGLSQLIKSQADLAVYYETGAPEKAWDRIEQGCPDLLIADLTMPGRGGIGFIKDVLARHPKLPILVLSMHDECVYAERTVRAGARGYIMKESGSDELLVAIRQVLDGDVYLSQKISQNILSNLSGAKPRLSHSPIEKLTDREFQIFQLIGLGKNSFEIAAELHLSSKTVDVHRASIKAKLGLASPTALVRHAVCWVEALPSPGFQPGGSD